jgi:hypothetical protein
MCELISIRTKHNNGESIKVTRKLSIVVDGHSFHPVRFFNLKSNLSSCFQISILFSMRDKINNPSFAVSSS